MKKVELAKIARLDNFIRMAATGTPEVLAERLGISRSSLFELISYMKEEMKAPIIYNRNRPSYVYLYPPRFYLGFDRERLNTAEMTDTHGGGEVNETANEKKSNKVKVEIEIDDDDFILDDDIDFNDLYH